MTTTDRLTTAITPALDAYSAALDAHGHNYLTDGACICGKVYADRRSAGRHIAAARRRAGKAYDEASHAAVMAILR